MPRHIFLQAHDPKRPQPSRRHALIYFLPGNPGLINFYTDFLNCLEAMLRSSSDVSTAYDIYGRDLLGFDDTDHEPFSTATGKERRPWDLNEMVDGMYHDVLSQRRRDGDGEGRYDFVVLVGHSVGAYIAVEMTARHEKMAKQEMDLRHGVLLFPALTWLCESMSGKKVDFLERWVLSPALGHHSSAVSAGTSKHLPPVKEVHAGDSKIGKLAGKLVRLALALIPASLLIWIQMKVNGSSRTAAETTASWLKSRDGLWQMVFLGLSEMRTIRGDVWDEGLWDMQGEGEVAPPVVEAKATDVAAQHNGKSNGGKRKFYAFYGKEDHWVPGHRRDEFVLERGDKARIIVDEGDVPHAFCLREDNSWFIARQVSRWVEEMEA